MRKILFLFVAIGLIAVSACNKISNKITTVVRDCTGTYIRYDGIDYKVCNVDKVASFADGQTVKTSFKKLKDCNGPGNTVVVCTLYHESGGWIDVKKISAQ